MGATMNKMSSVVRYYEHYCSLVCKISCFMNIFQDSCQCLYTGHLTDTSL